MVQVTSQSLIAQGKTVTVDGDIAAACATGLDKLVILGTDGFLRQFNTNLEQLLVYQVGIPAQVPNPAMISSNLNGDLVAVQTCEELLAVYAIDGAIEFVGYTQLAENAVACQVVSGLPSSNGILIVFDENFATIMETSKTCPVISTFRVSHSPVLYVSPLEQDGDHLLITSNKVRKFVLRDILIGKFQASVLRFPSPVTCASSTRLKDGKIVNVAICGGKLWQLRNKAGSGEDESLEMVSLCKLPQNPSLSNVNFFYLIPGNKVYLLHWCTRENCGRYIIDSDHKFLELVSDFQTNYDVSGFVLDPRTNSILAFGVQSGIKVLSQCLELEQVVKPLVFTDALTIMYEPDLSILFIVYPTYTIAQAVRQEQRNIQLREKHVLPEPVITIGSHLGMCMAVTESTLALFFRWSTREPDIHQLDEKVNQAVFHESTLIYTVASFTDVAIRQIDSLKGSTSKTLLSPSALVVFMRVIGHNLYYGTSDSKLHTYDLIEESHSSSLELNEVASDFIEVDWGSYTAFCDGTLIFNDGEHLHAIKIDAGPLKFVKSDDKLVAYGYGVWLLDKREPLRTSTAHESFNENLVGGVCILPYFDLSLLVLYRSNLHILSTARLPQIAFKPTIHTLGPSDTVIAMCMVRQFRVWMAATESELIFFDLKHRNKLTLNSDLNSGIKIFAISSVNFTLNGSSYTHILVSCVQNGQYVIRSLSIKRERGTIYARKRLKLVFSDAVHYISPGGEMVAQGTKLGTLSFTNAGLKCLPFYSFEGVVKHVSVANFHRYVGTSSGLYVFDGFGQQLNDPLNMVNRMRDCICHVNIVVHGDDLVVSAEANCFINVYKLRDKNWHLVSTLRSGKRINQMYVASSPTIPQNVVKIVALTSTGNFVDIQIQTDPVAIECGPYVL